MDWDIYPSAGELATRDKGRECLALWEKAPTEGDDAFLASMHPWDVVLLMEDDPHRTSSLGMHLPYEQAVGGRHTCHLWRFRGMPCAQGYAPEANAPP